MIENTTSCNVKHFHTLLRMLSNTHTHFSCIVVGGVVVISAILKVHCAANKNQTRRRILILVKTTLAMDDQRFFENTFADYSSEAGVKVNRSHIKSLIKVLVAQITRNTQKVGSSGDLYVGDAGKWLLVAYWCMAFMFQLLIFPQRQVSPTCSFVFGRPTCW